jgi:exonuclease SbcC
MLKIKTLYIHMFRCYKNKELTFVTENGEITPLVLISGGNGKGKTTIIDAVEWCLTGNIQHLNIPFEIRSKGDRQAANSFGLLRNKDCKIKEQTWVELTFLENNIESIIRRSTLKNELGADKTSLSITQAGKTLDSKAAHKWLVELFNSGDKLFSDFFYKYFICNLQKTEDFRSKSRKKMTEEFEDFTLEHSQAKQVLFNLEKLQIQLDTQVKDLISKKIPEEQLTLLEQELHRLKKTAQIPVYSQHMSYPGERLDVDLLNSEEQEIQLEILVAGGYHIAIGWLTELILTRRRLTVKVQFEDYRADIQQVIRKRLYDLNTLHNLEERRRKITEHIQFLDYQTLEQTGKFTSELEVNDLTLDDWNTRWGEYCHLNNTWHKTEILFEDCRKGDDLLTLFSRLVGVRQQIDDYRKEHKKCPLCGAEEPFASLPLEQLVLEAENYVKAHDAKKLKNEQRLKIEKELWITCQERLINDLRNILKIEEGRLNDEIDIYKKIITKTTSFFTNIKSLGLDPKQFADLITLNNYDDFAKINQNLIEEKESKIYSLLTFLGYVDCDNLITAPELLRETIIPLANKVPEKFINDEMVIRDKVASLRLRKGNRHFLDLTSELVEKRKQNTFFDEKINDKTSLNGLVKERAAEIRGKLNQIKNDEIESVAPYLFRIFSKLVKHSTIDGFQLHGNEAKETETKIMFMDNKKTPILNIISDGQLGAFMLSYLLGNAFRRKDTGRFHCYFVDDITNSMDDINLISFIDLIKYQLAASRNEDNKNTAINQFFFSTCDGNLKRMFQYKMDGFEIPVKLIDLDML